MFDKHDRTRTEADGYGVRSYDGKQVRKLSEKRRQESKSLRISEKTWGNVFELFNLDHNPEQIASK